MQQKTTSSEFLEWKLYLEQESNDFHREDYYLAQIAMEIQRSGMKDPNRVKLVDKLLKFTSQVKTTKSSEAKMAEAKWFFGGLVSMGKATDNGG